MSYIIPLDSTYQIPDRYSIVLFDNMHQTGGPISIPGCDRTQTGHCPESSLMMINESDPVYARRQHHPGPRPRYSLAAVNVGSYSHYGNPNTNAALTVKI